MRLRHVHVARCTADFRGSDDLRHRACDGRAHPARAALAGVSNVLFVAGDVFAGAFGEPASRDACLLFNILHCEQPVRLLAEAARVVRPAGSVCVLHWRPDPATPRGPSMEIRPRPEHIPKWAAAAGLLASPEGVVDLPPWHYGVRFRRVGVPPDPDPPSAARAAG